MLNNNYIPIERHKYNKLFIVDDRNLWASCEDQCNKDRDLILCIDFALKLDLCNAGYQVLFLDHLIDKDTMQHYNFEMHNFLNNWHKSTSGENLLMYKEFNIGDALLLNVYNDITFFCHFFFNLLALKEINYNTLYVCTEEKLIKDILKILEIEFNTVEINGHKNKPVYLFPISRWMNEKIGRTSFQHKIKDVSALVFDYIFLVFDSIFKQKKTRIYIQGYHPTFEIINRLKADKSFGLILGNYTGLKSILKERRLFISKVPAYDECACILEDFSKADKFIWYVKGIKISDYLHHTIGPIVVRNLDNAISKSKNIQSFFDKTPIKLMVPVTNLWLNNRLIMQYCKNNHIPIFMIINGLLNVEYSHDARDSDWVNCYSQSIKQEYFKDSKTAVPLGDPRMDTYAIMDSKQINREHPNIVIGAAGFDVTDLNSYLAYEFDFLHDILTAISRLRVEGRKNRTVLKVRANGYLNLYKSFVNEYFPDLQVQIEQTVPFTQVVKEADLYITFYSQTIIEASSLGIPVIYYKNDNQSIHAPFDNKSELTTAINGEDIKNKIDAFYNNDSCFDSFMDIQILEKYIGKLDGKNTQRNTDFIYSLIK